MELAYETLTVVLRTQEDDGFIPIVCSPDGEEHDETQPPILAWGFHELYRFTKNRDYLSENYDALKGYQFWNKDNRDSTKTASMTTA